MKYQTKSEVLEACDIRHNARIAGQWPDYIYENDTDELAPTPELMFVRNSEGLTISLVLSDERLDLSEPDENLLSFVAEHSDEMPAALAKEIRDEIIERSEAVGGIVRQLWAYKLDAEKLADLHRLYGSIDEDELERLIGAALPLAELAESIAQEFIFGSGIDAYNIDCSPSSQEFHRRMLSLGLYPTVYCNKVGDEESLLRMMYGDECFEGLSNAERERFAFENPEP